MRESRTYGSVRGALSNERPYRDISRRALSLTPHCKRNAGYDAGASIYLGVPFRRLREASRRWRHDRAQRQREP